MNIKHKDKSNPKFQKGYRSLDYFETPITRDLLLLITLLDNSTTNGSLVNMKNLGRIHDFQNGTPIGGL
jgi:hypothetical protein